jgi:CubicO group peptidase (beta-lactamase class C family)
MNSLKPHMNTGSMRLLLLIVSASSLISCGVENPSGSSHYQSYEWTTSSPQSQDLDPSLISAAVDEARSTGYFKSLLIVRNGFLVSEDYFDPGRYGRDDPWEVRSVTKSVTSALTGLLFQMGLLDSLDQKVLDLFPEYVSFKVDERMHNVTVRHLLTMTSGLPSDTDFELPSGYYDYMEAILEIDLVSNPGEQWHYSSLGVHLLSGIIARETGASTLTFASDYLCAPLGISIPVWAEDPQGYPFGGSGLSLTPRNMARFGFLYHREGLVDGRQILAAEWVGESLLDHTGSASARENQTNWGYGYLWWTAQLAGYSTYAAAGFAGQYIMIVPDLDMVIVSTADLASTFEQAHIQEDKVIELILSYILPAAT